MSCGPVVHREGQATRSRMQGRAAVLLSALLGVSLVGGCEGCGEEPPDNTGEPTMLITATSRQLQADGVSFVEVTVRAYDADNNPDNSAITVNIDSGTLASDVHNVGDDAQSLTGTPDNGNITFQFVCPELETGTVTISAQNAGASSSSTIECIEPVGSVTISVLSDDTYPCSDLLADGTSFCVVPLHVELRTANGVIVPQENLSLAATVENATYSSPEPGEDPVVTNLNLLTLDSDTAGLPQAQVSVVTDTNGDAAFRVRTRLDEAMTINIKITGTAANGEPLETTAPVSVGDFISAATLVLVPDEFNIGSGLTTQLQVSATDHRGGAPVDGSVIKLSVPPGAGATLTDGTATSDANGILETSIAGGSASVTFTAPTVTAETPVSVTVTYQPHPTLPVVSDAKELRIYPEGSLLLNVAVAPTTIRSDAQEVASITALVKEFSNGNVTEKQGATVRFRVSSLSRDRIGIGSRTTPGSSPPITCADPSNPVTCPLKLEQSVTTDADGVADVNVSSRNDRSRGDAEIIVEVFEGATVARTQTVTITLERDSILQSIVFLSAAPAAIGVRGGAYPSSSVVSFKVFDDLAAPLAGVPMRFDLNATSDAEAVVVGEGTTDANGVVRTTVSAGTQAAPISVVATATYGGRELTTESLPIAVTGGLPSFANSYMQCDPLRQAQTSPATLQCTVVLADRFTNRAPGGLPVQFRAEGGNIDAVVFTQPGGTAQATFNEGPPYGASTSLLSPGGDSWSYGAVVPTNAADTFEDDATRWSTSAETACFDGNSLTRCSVFDLCFEAEHAGTLDDNAVYCPLLVDPVDDVGCWNKLEAGAVTRDAAHLSDALLADLGIDRTTAQTILNSGMTAQNYFLNTGATADAVRGIVNAHLDNMFRCGPLTACITGNPAGVPFIDGDECQVAAGCMDFNPWTGCPHDGLRTITAIVRGEESFTDLNGNGILDFADTVSANGRHDPGEPIRELGPSIDVPFHDVVVDMPEPFLDKDDNCFADDYTGNQRMTTYNAIRRTDLYNDEDGSGTYGYADSVSDPPKLTNGQWDRDKEIFFSDHLLVLEGGARLEIGAPCLPGEVGTQMTCPFNDPGNPTTYLCVEAGDGTGVLVGCHPRASSPALAPGQGFDLRFRWIDGNGNCYSPGFDNVSWVYDDSPYISSLEAYNRTFSTAPLDRAFCGFGQTQVPRREWCAARPRLGAANFMSSSYTPSCYTFESGIVPRRINYVLTDGNGFVIGDDDNHRSFAMDFKLACP